MNKLKLASLTLLLASVTALPAMAQSAGGEQSRQGGGRYGDLNKGPVQSENRGDRGEDRGEGRGEGRGDDRDDDRGDRGDRGENRGDRQDWQASDRGNRDYRGDGRDNRGNDNRGNDYRGYDNRGNNNGNRGYDNRGHNDGNRGYNGRGYENRGYANYGYDRRDHNRYVRHSDRRWSGNQWYPQYRYRAPVRYVYPRGYRAYQWRVGHRLPSSYYHNNYYVDYNAYSLPPPPYGYHWVRVDRDVVLVAIASGLIRDILYGLYY